MQKEEKQKSLASPTEPQTKGLHFASNKWSIVSFSHRHRQHQLIRGKLFLTRLSMVRIPLLAAVQKKKATLISILTHQMLFQGKDIYEAFNNEI